MTGERKKPCRKPPKKRFTASVLAFPRRFEHPTYRLGGDRSIQLSYGNVCSKYSISSLRRIRTDYLLRGERSIRLSYWYIVNFRRQLQPLLRNTLDSFRMESCYSLVLQMYYYYSLHYVRNFVNGLFIRNHVCVCRFTIHMLQQNKKSAGTSFLC